MWTSLSTFQKNTTSFMTRENTNHTIINKKVTLEEVEVEEEAEVEEEIIEEACTDKKMRKLKDLIKKPL